MNKLFGLLLLALSFVSCRKEATLWYSDWVLPVAGDTLDLGNLTNDSTLAVENGIYVLDLHRKIASINLSEYIELPDTTIEQKFAISFSTLNVPAGSSFVNSNEDHVFDLDDMQLKQARVKSGRIILEVFSPVETTTFFEIELPSVTSGSEVVKKTLSVAPGTLSSPASNSMEIDLAGYVIDLRGSNGLEFNSLPSKLKVTSDPSGSAVVLHSTDSTRFIIRMENIRLDYARGYFGQQKIADNYVFDSKFLKNQVEGLLDLSAINLQLDFVNSIKVSAKANLKKLKNTNTDNGNSVELSNSVIGNPFIVQSASGNWDNLQATEKSLTFNSGNSNLESFVENLGDQTQIDYELELNPWGNTSGGWDEFFPQSALDVELHAQMPLNIGMDDLVLTDVFDFAVEQDYSKTRVQSGNLVLKIENAFPLQGDLELEFLDAAGQIIQSISNVEKIQSAAYGLTNSLGILSKKSELTVPFPEDLLLRLNDIKQIRAVLKLNTPDPVTGDSQQVSIPEKAFFYIRVQTNFKLENHLGE
ncbi:MAG: hypothetical protein K0R65_810 [Crocinitomicaceae bacterium]|jgi:hypothetical protein|nr:hypothetical protein [Crocinitomicaceae bacterium]